MRLPKAKFFEIADLLRLYIFPKGTFLNYRHLDLAKKLKVFLYYLKRRKCHLMPFSIKPLSQSPRHFLRWQFLRLRYLTDTGSIWMTVNTFSIHQLTVSKVILEVCQSSRSILARKFSVFPKLKKKWKKKFPNLKSNLVCIRHLEPLIGHLFQLTDLWKSNKIISNYFSDSFFSTSV